MRHRLLSLVLVMVFATGAAVGCRTAKGSNPQEKRNYTLHMEKQTLAELYQKHPDARAHVRGAPGYAVFSNMGSKLLMVATGSGYGVATDNRTGKKTYMRMVEAGGGLGMGIKSYRAVYVFNRRSTFDSFVKGDWQAGGDADIGAEYKGTGVVAGTALTTDQLARPVTIYQFTSSGISFAAVATGTRYYPDSELN